MKGSVSARTLDGRDLTFEAFKGKFAYDDKFFDQWAADVARFETSFIENCLREKPNSFEQFVVPIKPTSLRLARELRELFGSDEYSPYKRADIGHRQHSNQSQTGTMGRLRKNESPAQVV